MITWGLNNFFARQDMTTTRKKKVWIYLVRAKIFLQQPLVGSDFWLWLARYGWKFFGCGLPYSRRSLHWFVSLLRSLVGVCFNRIRYFFYRPSPFDWHFFGWHYCVSILNQSVRINSEWIILLTRRRHVLNWILIYLIFTRLFWGWLCRWY